MKPADSAKPSSVAVLPGLAASRSRLSDYAALAKPRLNALVVASAGVGYYLGAAGRIDPATLAHTLLGTALVAAGASALNQVFERRTDGLMRRTCLRPLPGQRLTLPEAMGFGCISSTLGATQLALGANPLAALVAVLTLVFYALVYTPLKRRTPMATIVGAIPGAMPPMIGWAAATGSLTLEAWVLFAIVFLWQMPHFLAIAWLYREDYERAGIPLLPVVEPDGRSTARQAMLYTLALVPVSLMPSLVSLAGWWYLAGALLLGAALAVIAFAFVREQAPAQARRLFVASIVYLPLLWSLMVANHVRY
jgi:protoheme IX farnesyltransferase